MKKFTEHLHDFVLLLVCLALWLTDTRDGYGEFLAISISSERALPMEELILKVVIKNTSSMTIRLNPKPDQMDFYLWISKERKEDVIPLDELADTAIIMPGETVTNFFDIGGHSLLLKPGFYSIRAELIINDKLLKSNLCELEIAKGTELARLSGMTIGSDAAGVKSYVLEYLKKARGEDLYLRFEDSSSETTFGVYNLGRVVRAYPPQIKLDEAGNIHVLFQTINARFVHSIFTPFGVPIRSVGYSGYASAAMFQEKADGELAVAMKDGSPLVEINSFQLEREKAPQEEAPPPAVKKKITKTGGLFGNPPQ